MKQVDYTKDYHGFFYVKNIDEFWAFMQKKLKARNFGEASKKSYKQTHTMLNFCFSKAKDFPFAHRIKLYNKLMQGIESAQVFMAVGNGLRSIYEDCAKPICARFIDTKYGGLFRVELSVYFTSAEEQHYFFDEPTGPELSNSSSGPVDFHLDPDVGGFEYFSNEEKLRPRFDALDACAKKIDTVVDILNSLPVEEATGFDIPHFNALD